MGALGEGMQHLAQSHLHPLTRWNLEMSLRVQWGQLGKVINPGEQDLHVPFKAH